MYLNELAGDSLGWNTTALRARESAERSISVSMYGQGIRIDLPRGTPVIVERLDLSGRILETLYSGALKKERAIIPFDRNRKAAASASLLRVRVAGLERVIPLISVQ
jgi:hypothetical protein